METDEGEGDDENEEEEIYSDNPLLRYLKKEIWKINKRFDDIETKITSIYTVHELIREDFNTKHDISTTSLKEEPFILNNNDDHQHYRDNDNNMNPACFLTCLNCLLWSLCCCSKSSYYIQQFHYH